MFVGPSANTLHLPCHYYMLHPYVPLQTHATNTHTSAGVPPKWLLPTTHDIQHQSGPVALQSDFCSGEKRGNPTQQCILYTARLTAGPTYPWTHSSYSWDSQQHGEKTLPGMPIEGKASHCSQLSWRQLWLSHSRRMHAVHMRTPMEYLVLLTSGDCATRHNRTSSKQGHYCQDQKT